MPDVTPAQELRAAAERLRELAAKATPGPWTAELRPYAYASQPGEECWVTGPLGLIGRIEVARGYAYEADDEHGPWLAQEDADWIATLSPAIAEPLAMWLEAEAEIAAVVVAGQAVAATGAFDLRVTASSLDQALAFARAILAAAPTPSPTGSNPGGET